MQTHLLEWQSHGMGSIDDGMFAYDDGFAAGAGMGINWRWTAIQRTL
jgi:hypothetical protein